MPILLLPDELREKSFGIVKFCHPKSNSPSRFVLEGGKLWEVLTISPRNHKRSLMIGERIVSDPTFDILVRFDPLFLILRVLWLNRQRMLPLEFLLELSSGSEAETPPIEIMEPRIDVLCDVKENLSVQLNLEKLQDWLNTKFSASLRNLPPSIAAHTLQAVTPLDPTEDVDPAICEEAKLHAALCFLGSWLPPQVAEWYESKHNTSRASEEARKISLAQAEARAVRAMSEGSNKNSMKTAKSKRTASAPAGNTKKMKVTNNRSLLDMFGSRK